MSEWTRQHSGVEIMELLQAAGIAAAPVQDVEDQLTDNEQFAFRKLYVSLDEPEMGQIVTESPPVKMSETPPRVCGPAPLIGEHTQSVMREALGLGGEAIRELIEQGVLA